MQELEVQNPTADPINSPLFSGNWALLYTAAINGAPANWNKAVLFIDKMRHTSYSVRFLEFLSGFKVLELNLEVVVSLVSITYMFLIHCNGFGIVQRRNQTSMQAQKRDPFCHV
jgi:hypothetical protein